MVKLFLFVKHDHLAHLSLDVFVAIPVLKGGCLEEAFFHGLFDTRLNAYEVSEWIGANQMKSLQNGVSV